MSGQAAASNLLDNRFGYLLHDVARLIRREFDRRIKELGLTRAQWVALAALIQQDGLTQTELAFMLDMGRAPLGTLIDRLERDGWVERKPDPKDRRANRVYITRKINPLIAELGKVGAEVQALATAELPEDEIKRMMDTLSRIKANLIANQPD